MFFLHEKKLFHDKGYFKIPSFYNSQEIEYLSECINNVIEWKDSSDKWMRWYEKSADGKKEICRIENFLDYYNDLKNMLLGQESKVVNLVSFILEENVELFKEKINIKSPKGGGYVPHQDIYNINSREVDAVVMLAIDTFNLANGCVQFVSGKHKEGIISRDENGKILKTVHETYNWEPLNLLPGDIVVFDNYTPHYSEPNTTNYSRKGLFLAFKKNSTNGRSREEYYEFKRKINPSEIADATVDNLRPSCTIIYNDYKKEVLK
jgi:hypothetical protein